MSRRCFISLLVLFLGSRKKWGIPEETPLHNYRELRSFFFDSSNINPVAGSVTPKLGCSNGMGFSPSGKNRFNRGKKGRRWLRSLKSHRVCGVCSGESMKDPTRILPPIPLPFHHGWKWIFFWYSLPLYWKETDLEKRQPIFIHFPLNRDCGRKSIRMWSMIGKHSIAWAIPLPRMPFTTRSITCLVGGCRGINLHLPLLIGNLCAIFCYKPFQVWMEDI